MSDEVYGITEDRTVEEASSLPPNSVRHVAVAFAASGIIVSRSSNSISRRYTN